MGHIEIGMSNGHEQAYDSYQVERAQADQGGEVLTFTNQSGWRCQVVVVESGLEYPKMAQVYVQPQDVHIPEGYQMTYRMPQEVEAYLVDTYGYDAICESHPVHRENREGNAYISEYCFTVGRVTYRQTALNIEFDSVSE